LFEVGDCQRFGTSCQGLGERHVAQRLLRETRLCLGEAVTFRDNQHGGHGRKTHDRRTHVNAPAAARRTPAERLSGTLRAGQARSKPAAPRCRKVATAGGRHAAAASESLVMVQRVRGGYNERAGAALQAG
jgi:hypothetical protein